MPQRTRGRAARHQLAYQALELRQLLAAAPAITEFMASNLSTINDGNGSASDWIEIFNNGDQAAQLQNYALTDDSTNLTKWQFPAGAVLNPNQRMIVFASGDGVADPTGKLHTNFKLSAGGEYLALVQTTTMTVVTEFGVGGVNYPEQFTDVSYGIGFGNVLGYFYTPTPGTTNGLAEPTYSARAVTFSRPAGVYSEATFQLTLATDTTGGTIHYTSNGSEPTSTSTVYSSPLTILGSVNVRARVVTAGGQMGPVFGAGYTKLASQLETRTSELPIVVLDNYGGGGITNSYKDFSFSLYEVDPITGVSSLANAADVATPSGIHLRGSSSSGFAKKQYRLELRDQTGEDLDFSLAGMAEESDWVLFGPYVDKSLIRNPLAYEIGRELGLEAPNTRFVELYLKDGNTNSTLSESNYLGVYTIRENIKIGKNRVDIPKLSAGDVAEPDITGGYLFAFDKSPAPGGIVYQSDDDSHLQIIDPDNYTAAQRAWITDYLLEFRDVLFSSDYADPVNGYAKYIDVDSFVNMVVLNELIRDQDSYGISNFFYKDRGGKITQGPLWDYNLTLGVGGGRDNQSSSGWQYQNNGFYDGAGWIVRLMEDPNFELKVRDRWSEMRKTVLSLDNLNSLIDGFVADLGTAPDRNFDRWDILNSNVPFSSPNTQTWTEQIDIIRNFLSSRIAWMDSQLLDPAAPSITPGSGTVPVGTNLEIATLSGGIEVPLLQRNSPVRALVPTDGSLDAGTPSPTWTAVDFDDTQWISGTNGVGYERNTNGGYNALIGTSINTQWEALNGQPQGESSVYTRFEFQISQQDLADLQQLLLTMHGDDGYVVYLNGIEIVSQRAPANTDWQSNATGSLSDGGVTSGELIDLTTFKSLLRTGLNVLAIHGLNVTDSSSDLLVYPELTMKKPGLGTAYYTTDGSDPRNLDGTPAASASLYTGPVAISSNLTVKARGFEGNQWSPLSIAEIEVSGTTAPTVTDTVRDSGNTSRPDQWTTYAVTFNSDVAIGADDLSLRNETLGGSIANLAGVGFNYNATTFTATWTFSGISTPLPAAYYTAILNASSITATAGGLTLDGDADGSPGGDYTQAVYQAIPGDLNLDGDVDVFQLANVNGQFQNVGDLAVLKSNLGSIVNVGWNIGDLNADGDVDVFDFRLGQGNVGDLAILLSNLGRNVRPPAGAPANLLVTTESRVATPLTTESDDLASDNVAPISVNQVSELPVVVDAAELAAVIPTASQVQPAQRKTVPFSITPSLIGTVIPTAASPSARALYSVRTEFESRPEERIFTSLTLAGSIEPANRLPAQYTSVDHNKNSSLSHERDEVFATIEEGLLDF